MKFPAISNRLLLPAFIFLLIGSGTLSAQVIKSEVILHTKALTLEEQRYLKGFEKDVIRIIDDYRWTESNYRYELPIHIEIFLEEATLMGSYHNYKAGVMAATRQGVQIRDNRWDFRLNRDLGLHIAEPYDTFSAMFEYLVWICLGFEADRLSVLGGSEYFEKARLITERARFENRFYNGWDERRLLVEALIVKKAYKSIREASFHVNAGFYYMDKGDTAKARPHLYEGMKIAMRGSPKMMEVIIDDSIFRFIDRERLAKVLFDLEEYDLLDNLAGWDNENAEIYSY
ncbi:DUF4835 family protein [bacterium]|nr:DUF4835 family protein [bacterium]